MTFAHDTTDLESASKSGRGKPLQLLSYQNTTRAISKPRGQEGRSPFHWGYIYCIFLFPPLWRYEVILGEVMLYFSVSTCLQCVCHLVFVPILIWKNNKIPLLFLWEKHQKYVGGPQMHFYHPFFVFQPHARHRVSDCVTYCARLNGQTLPLLPPPKKKSFKRLNVRNCDVT